MAARRPDIAGRGRPFTGVPFFWTQQFDAARSATSASVRASRRSSSPATRPPRVHGFLCEAGASWWPPVVRRRRDGRLPHAPFAASRSAPPTPSSTTTCRFYVFALPAWQFVYSLPLRVSRRDAGRLGRRAPRSRRASGAAARRPLRTGGPCRVRARRRRNGRAVRAYVTGVDVEDGTVAHVSALLGALFVLGGSATCSRPGACCTPRRASCSAPATPTCTCACRCIRVLMVLALALGARSIYNAVRGRPQAVAAARRRRLAGRGHRPPRHRAGRLAGALRQPRTSWPRRRRTSPQHRRHARRLRPHGDHRDAVLAAGRPLGGHAADQQRHRAQHPPVGPGGAAAQLQPAPGAAAVLLVHDGQRRPLPGQRGLHADDAGAARAARRRAAVRRRRRG